MKIDLVKKDNQLLLNNIELGSAVKSALVKTKVKDDAKLKFKKECVTMLLKIVEKMVERCPLNYSVVRNATCLVPVEMINSSEECVLRANRLIQKLFDLNILSATVSDKGKQEYQEFLSSVCKEKKDEFLSFDKSKDRLDRFLVSLLHGNSRFINLFKACKIILTLSHGQSDVERGFSINKEMMVENMKQSSVVSQRMICDHMTAAKIELHEFKITKELLVSCRTAAAKYRSALKEQKENEIISHKANKRKMIQDEILQIKRKKEDMQKCIASLDKDIVKLSFEAEKTEDFDLLVKANSFRRTKEDKLKSVESLDKAAEKLENDLKAFNK